MSKLETRVRPTIKAFSVGDSLALVQGDTAGLSAWILKTLALYNITSNYRSLVDPNDFRHLYQQRLPSPGRHIELAYLPAEEPSVFKTRMAPIKFLLLPSESDKEEITRRVDRSSFVLTMQIGKLPLQAVGLPRFGMWGRTDERRKDVLRIYPQIPESVIWPPRFGFDGSIDDLNAQVGLRLLFSGTILLRQIIPRFPVPDMVRRELTGDAFRLHHFPHLASRKTKPNSQSGEFSSELTASPALPAKTLRSEPRASPVNGLRFAPINA